MTKVIMNKEEIQKISDILSKFPDVSTFQLHQDNGSGIGSVTELVFNHTVNGYTGEFCIEISGVENW